jgi:hypothetical protein
MAIITTLHNLLKRSLPGIHAARLQELMAAVEAGLTGTSLSITALGGLSLKLFYLALMNISKKRTMPLHEWKASLNRFSIQFEDRMPSL